MKENKKRKRERENTIKITKQSRKKTRKTENIIDAKRMENYRQINYKRKRKKEGNKRKKNRATEKKKPWIIRVIKKMGD